MGCSDAFSIFGFLAFILALLNLLMTGGDMGMGGTRRRKRDNSDVNPDLMKSGLLAAHHLLQGFLQALDSPDQMCAGQTLCKAAENAAKFGDVGRAFVEASR